MSYCHRVTLHHVDVPAQRYMPPQAGEVQMCLNWAPLHGGRSLNQAPAAATSGANAQAQPHCTGYQNAPCCQKLSPLHDNMVKAEHFTREVQDAQMFSYQTVALG